MGRKVRDGRRKAEEDANPPKAYLPGPAGWARPRVQDRAGPGKANPGPCVLDPNQTPHVGLNRG